MNPLIPFFEGKAPDSFGRFFDDILSQDDFWLEYTHNYIQWLFPNQEPSGVYKNAPTINDEVITAFAENPLLQQQLRRALMRMLAFYGLEMENITVKKAGNWDARKKNWFTRRNHNALRITRILKCLMTLGLKDEAIAFYDALVKLADTEPVCSISRESFLYWYNAVTHQNIST